MTGVFDRIMECKCSGDPSDLCDAIPYASFLGIELIMRDGDLLGTMPFAEHLVGNPTLPALHGGTLGSLLESTAILTVLWEVEVVTLPKTINITIDYLRSARPIETFALAVIKKQGRRVVNVRTEAWQEDRERPVAAATANFLLSGE